MFNSLRRYRVAIIGAISMLAGCGENYEYDQDIIKELKSQEGVFRLDKVFGEYEWTMICQIRDYQSASAAVFDGIGPAANRFRYVPRDYYIEEGHVGLALVDAESTSVQVFPIPWREIAGFYGSPCLLRERAYATVRRHPNSVYGDSWSLTFIDASEENPPKPSD